MPLLKIILSVAVLLSFALPFPASAQSEHPVTGRQISGIMGVSGADWLERSERELEEMPETALDNIGILKGMTVADMGAGSGYFTVRLAKRVGDSGTVYAVDVQPAMLSLIRKRMHDQKLTNIKPILASESDPGLPKNSLDLILMVDVYHELSQPQKVLRKLRSALKSDGRLVVMEYRKEDPHIPIRADHKMSAEEVRLELEAEGYKLEKAVEDLPRQHILIFRKDAT
jgi:ubiquinone/menaquinone biosynthesis C-methylase UbiE